MTVMDIVKIAGYNNSILGETTPKEQSQPVKTLYFRCITIWLHLNLEVDCNVGKRYNSM
jgi:hypothetical protein